jgi:hypothetical protein
MSCFNCGAWAPNEDKSSGQCRKYGLTMRADESCKTDPFLQSLIARGVFNAPRSAVVDLDAVDPRTGEGRRIFP